MLDTTTGKLTTVGEKNVYGGFSDETYDISWSPDSKWIAYVHSMPNHLHAVYLYSVDTGQSTQVTNEIADSRLPAFDRDGKYLYFAASTNAGATSDGLDMTSDLYQVTVESLCRGAGGQPGFADSAGTRRRKAGR